MVLYTVLVTPSIQLCIYSTMFIIRLAVYFAAISAIIAIMIDEFHLLFLTRYKLKCFISRLKFFIIGSKNYF